MSASGGNWKLGYILSEDEVEHLESATGLDEVIAVTTHPSPGVHFTDPYEGTYLQRNAANQVFASEADPEDSESNPNQVIFLGDASSDEELISMATAFITADDHEIAAAIYFHFTESSFGSEEWFWQALPEFYWFRLGANYERRTRRFDIPSRPNHIPLVQLDVESTCSLLRGRTCLNQTVTKQSDYSDLTKMGFQTGSQPTSSHLSD
jgi:hypothetical protein